MPIVSDLLAPDDVRRSDLTRDQELGGIALNDPSQGMQVKTWTGYYDAGQVFLEAEGVAPTAVLAVAAPVDVLAISFDQLMRPLVAWQSGADSHLYFYDTSLGATTTLNVAGASSPFLTHDDKRVSQTGLSDVLFFYIKAGNVYYRQQRDRFGVERLIAAVPAGFETIDAVGMAENNRLAIRFAKLVWTTE
jgi:hypothetical protein